MRYIPWAAGMFVTAFYVGVMCARLQPNPSFVFKWWEMLLAFVTFAACAFFFRTEK